MKKTSWYSKAYMSVALGFLYLPILVLIVFSFNESKSRGVFTGFTLDWYVKLFHNEMILSALFNTLVIAAIASVVATVIGTLAAIGINGMKKWAKSLVMNITYLPIINPEIVTGVSMLLLFVFIRDKFNVDMELGFFTLLLAHITFCTPYVILNVLPKLRQMDKHTFEAAQDLGCSPAQAIWKVVIPEIMPGIMAGFLMAFTYSIDDFIISYFVSGPTSQTLPIAIYSMTRRKVSPQINALSTIIFVVVLLVLLGSNIVEARREKRLNRKEED